MLRFIKHSSREELYDKICHLGFNSANGRSFIERGGGIVLVDRFHPEGGQVAAFFSREKVQYLYEGRKLLIGFKREADIDNLVEGTENGKIKKYLEGVKRTIARIRTRHPVLYARGRTLELGSKPPLLMGVLNVTPDSFSDGGKFLQKRDAVHRAREMISEGADIIDVGGESTRPGAAPVKAIDEMKRVLPVIEKVAASGDALISIDTYKSSVAREALKVGAHMVNDISGLRYSPDMAEVITDHDAAVIIMHMQGTPRNMQEEPRYETVTDDILEYLDEGVRIGKKSGIKEESILVDPGIGFGKRYHDNLFILKNLEEFRSAGYPVVVGPSRKAFIGEATGKNVMEREFGTAAAAAIAVYNGADVLRVHDVRQIRDVVLMSWEIKKGGTC